MVQKIKITSKYAQTQVEIDGHEVHGIRSLWLYQDTHTDIPVLRLDISALDIEVEAEKANVMIKEES